MQMVKCAVSFHRNLCVWSISAFLVGCGFIVQVNAADYEMHVLKNEFGHSMPLAAIPPFLDNRQGIKVVLSPPRASMAFVCGEFHYVGNSLDGLMMKFAEQYKQCFYVEHVNAKTWLVMPKYDSPAMSKVNDNWFCGC